jgi:hypothetical protein
LPDVIAGIARCEASMTALDPFTLARAAEADAALLDMFRQWVEAEREADKYGWENPDDECGFDVLADASLA